MNNNKIQDLFLVPYGITLNDIGVSLNNLSALCRTSDFILYGAGETGRLVVNKLRSVGIAPKAFADDTISKQGGSAEGIKVYSPEETGKIFGKDVPVIITIFQPSVSFLSIKEKLKSKGFCNIYSVLELFHSYPDIFLPYYQFDKRSVITAAKTELLKAFCLFEEEESQKIFLSNLELRLNLDFRSINKADNKHYFPQDIFPGINSTSSIYIDCGAYDGDTIKKFLLKCKTGSKIFAFEPDEYNFKKLAGYITSLGSESSDNIYLYPFGVSDHHGFYNFSSSGTMGSAFHQDGNTIIQMIALDDLFYEMLKNNQDALFIKMDIEGEEEKALHASRKIIIEKSPNLAVSIYHKPDDLWKIPLFIKSINPLYKFYLRQHGEDGMDLVFYAKK